MRCLVWLKQLKAQAEKQGIKDWASIGGWSDDYLSGLSPSEALKASRAV